MNPVFYKIELEGELYMSEETINVAITVNAGTSGTLLVVDANGNILPDGADISIQPESVGVADPGQELFTVSGGTAPYTISLSGGALPAGDQVNQNDNGDGSTTFTLSGTPTAAGDFNFALLVTDAAGTTATFRGKVAPRKTAGKTAIRG